MKLTLPNKAITRISTYMKAREDLMPGGKGDAASVLDFSKEQLVKGILVEYEHTNDLETALEIVLDHLTENGTYYKYLADAEDKMKAAAGRRSIDPVDQLFDYAMNTLYNLHEGYKSDTRRANANNYAHLLERVINVIDPLD